MSITTKVRHGTLSSFINMTSLFCSLGLCKDIPQMSGKRQRQFLQLSQWNDDGHIFLIFLVTQNIFRSE